MKRNQYGIAVFIVGLFAVTFFVKANYAQAVQSTQSTPPVNTQIKSLVLALEKDYPPFLFYQGGSAQGISYDYTRLMAEKLSLDLKTTEPMQLQQMLDAVKSGKANILADVTKNVERDAYLEFSNPYIETPAVVIGRNNEVSKWNRLSPNKGLKIAVGKGYAVESYLKTYYPNAEYVEFPSDSDVVKATSLGAVDVGVLDSASLSYLQKDQPLANIEIIADTGYIYSLSFAVSEANKAFIPSINDALTKITPQEKAQIQTRWQAEVPRRSASADAFGTLPSYVYFLAFGLMSAVLITIIWLFFMRKTVREKTRQLAELNATLDKRVQEKTHYANDMLQKAELEASHLDDTKKAMLNLLEDTEQERNTLAEVTARFKLATESAGIGVWEWRPKSHELVWDDQMYKIFGIEKKQHVDTFDTWQKSIFSDDMKLTEDYMQGALDGKKDYNFVYRITLPNKDIRYIRAIAFVERDKHKQPIKMVGVNWDITQEKIIDQEKSEFVSLASHQLRTPLTAIGWYTELLLKDVHKDLTREQRSYLKEVATGNRRMTELVNALLNLSRLELGTVAIQPQDVEIQLVLESIQSEVAHSLKTRHQSLKTTIANNLPNIKSDPQLLRIVLQNLVTNAIKYTPEKGSILINVELYKTPKSVHGHSLAKNTVLFSVQDNGYGVPKKEQEKIFEKLFRASNIRTKDTDGTGLGLYMVKLLCGILKSDIWLKSIENRGTTFYVAVPLDSGLVKSGSKQLEI